MLRQHARPEVGARSSQGPCPPGSQRRGHAPRNKPHATHPATATEATTGRGNGTGEGNRDNADAAMATITS